MGETCRLLVSSITVSHICCWSNRQKRTFPCSDFCRSLKLLLLSGGRLRGNFRLVHSCHQTHWTAVENLVFLLFMLLGQKTNLFSSCGCDLFSQLCICLVWRSGLQSLSQSHRVCGASSPCLPLITHKAYTGPISEAGAEVSEVWGGQGISVNM